MHTIQISAETFTRLQAQAVPLVDTVESVINRALDALESNSDGPAQRTPSSSSLNPASPPNLSFTTVRQVLINDKELPAEETYWNSALLAMAKEAASKGVTGKQLSKILLVKNSVGAKAGTGFKHVKEADVSIQGQDANGAWKAVFYIARELSIPVDISFVWQNTPKATFPGETGHLSYVPA